MPGGRRACRAGSEAGGNDPAARCATADAQLGQRVLEAVVQQHEPLDEPADVLQRGRDGVRPLHEEPEEAVEVAAVVVLAQLRLARGVPDRGQEQRGDPAVQRHRRPREGGDRVVDLVGGHARARRPAVGGRRRGDDQPDRAAQQRDQPWPVGVGEQVVGVPQHRRQLPVDAGGRVAERLSGEQRRVLEEAGALGRVLVLPPAQDGQQVRDHGHGGQANRDRGHMSRVAAR
jgi:hypothetical protein